MIILVLKYSVQHLRVVSHAEFTLFVWALAGFRNENTGTAMITSKFPFRDPDDPLECRFAEVDDFRIFAFWGYFVPRERRETLSWGFS
jgi:hypothetical protein